jgi:teichuronic acid biosynthesis glycosyltransferase TuaC
VLRVLWVTNMFHEEGAEGFRGIFVTELRKSLLATGRVHLDLEIVAQGRGPLDYLLANARVRRRWDSGHYDLVHVHYGLTGLATLLLPSDVPLVTTFYGSDMNQPLERRLSIAAARRSRRRIFVSRRLADHWPSPRNLVVPNGVDFERCAPRDRTSACEALGLDPARKWVLFGGLRENSVKQYDVYRDVLGRLTQRLPDVAELVLSDRWQPYSRVVEKLNAADVLLFTSRRGTEGSPTVVKEALAVGLPVVSVDVGDAREMLSGVEPGAIVSWPEDSGPAARERWLQELAETTARVLEDGRRSDGREKRAFLRQEKLTERLLGIYADVVANRAGGETVGAP